MEVPLKSNLALKLCKIMAECKDIPKKGYNKHFNYNYHREEDITAHLRPLFVKHGIFVFASVKSSSREGDLTHLEMEYTFTDSETGEQHTVIAVGSGKDSQDKGVYKAYTGAHKYFLLRNFNIGSDQDPELEETTEKTKIPRGPARGTSTPPVQKGSPPKNLKSDGVEVPLFDEPGEVMTDKGMKVKEVWAKHPVKATQKAKEIFDRIAINDHLQSWEQALIDYGVEKGLLTDA